MVRRILVVAIIMFLAFGASANSAPVPWMQETLAVQINFSMIAFNGMQPPGAYQGDPNIAAASITPSATCSRISGLAPFFYIQCSAKLTTGSGTGVAVPYEQFEYSWNFGDPAGTRFMTIPTTGALVNANDGQIKPEAAYVYDGVGTGTYTVTLNVRACSSGNCVVTPTYVTASTTVTITLSTRTFSGGEFFYSAAGSGTTCSSGAPCAITQFASKLASHTAHHFKKGDVFSGSATIDMISASSMSDVLLDSNFGSGANPVINVSSGANNVFQLGNGSGSPTKSDFVTKDLTLSNSGTYSAGNIILLQTGNNGILTDVYFDGVTALSVLDIPGFTNVELSPTEVFNTDDMERVGFWNVTLQQPLTTLTTNDGMLGGPYQWLFVVGGGSTGAGHDPIRDHHYYLDVLNNLLFEWVTCGNSDPTGTAPTRNFCLRTAYDQPTGSPNFFGNYYVISENLASGTHAAFTGPANANNDPAVSRIGNFIVERNAEQNLSDDCSLYAGTAQTITVRHERAWTKTGANRWWCPEPLQGTTTFATTRVYGNLIYGSSTGAVMDYTGIVWTTPAFITDNVVWCAVTNCNENSIVFTDQTSAGSFIDRNDWYAPNDSDAKYLFNNFTAVAFGPAGTSGTWQNGGWDIHGITTQPTWGTVPPTSYNSFNFLLKRDLDPVANVNTPMWLNEAA